MKILNHLPRKASGTSSDCGVASGVVAAEGAGELRHRGHVAVIRSHSSMQSEWKQWLQSGMHRTVSLGWYSDKQMEHCPSSFGFGSRRLSPTTIFVYDSMTGPSRPMISTSGSDEFVDVVVLGRPLMEPLLLARFRRVEPPALTRTQA